MNINTPQPPNSEDAERAVLGALIIDAISALPRVAAMLKPDDFYLIKHQAIFGVIMSLPADGIDILTLSAALDARKLLSETGGEPYLGELMAVVPTALNVMHYAAIVADHAVRRRMLQAASAIAMEAYDMEHPASGILEFAHHQVVKAHGFATRAMRSTTEIAEAMSDEYPRRVRGELPSAMGPGIDGLAGLWSLKPGRLSLIGARPGVGKSAFMLHISTEAMVQSRKPVFFSLEMPEEELAARIVTRLNGMSFNLETVAEWSPPQHEAYGEALERLKKLPMTMAYMPGLTFVRLRAECQRLKATKGLDLVCVDYVQIMGERPEKGETRMQVLEGLTRNFKTMAGELNLHVLAGSQLNRHDLQRPSLANLREAGLENDADTILLMSRPDEANPGELLLDVAKNRDGKTGSVQVLFDGGRMKFSGVR